jgi:nucleoside-diphosphate-sugar epimerase
LLEEGWQVSAIVRKQGRSLQADLQQKIPAFIYDGSIESLVKATNTAKPNVVFHLASLFVAEHRQDQVTDLINSNVLFASHLAEACIQAGVRCLVNTGTSWQHYRSEDYDPVCLYAATKQAAEDILDFYADAFDLNIITLKLFDTYGIDDTRQKLLNLLMSALKTGDQIAMSEGKQLVDLVYIDDVINAYWVAAQRLTKNENANSHERYSVSTCEAISVQELVSYIEEVSNRTLNAEFGLRPYRKREVMVPYSAANWLPGWMPLTNVRAGISNLIGSLTL